MVNHSVLCWSIKYDYMNILTWTILKKTQIVNGCETFAFKYICNHNLLERYIVNKHRCHMNAMFGVFVNEDLNNIAALYGLPKPKRSYKTQLIAIS